MNSVDNPQIEPRIELLRYIPNSPVTYEKWLRALYAKAGKNYGIYATIFLTGVRHVPALPTPLTGHGELPRHNPGMILFNRRIENYAKDMTIAETNDQKLFWLMFENMSEDSLNRASRVIPVEDWLAVLRIMNAQELINKTRALHQGAGAAIPALNWDGSSVSWQKMVQEQTEDLNEYKARFDSAMRSMESVTHPNIPNQALRAVRFLNGLDKRRYRNLLSHVENEAVSGAAEYPATLDRAFSRAVNYRLEMNATPRVGKPDPPMPSAAVMLVEPTPPRTRPPRRAGKSTSTTPTSTTSKIDSKPPSGTIKPKFVHKPCKL